MNQFITITTQHTVDAKAFASSILGSAFDSYDWYEGVEYVEGCDWDVIPSHLDASFVEVCMENPESGSRFVTKSLSVNDLKRAYEEVAKSCRVDWEDIDADLGDRIIQHAVLGEYVYG